MVARFTLLAALPKRSTMPKEIEIPIKAKAAREQLGIGVSMFSAIKSVMGLKNTHRVIVSAVRQWMSENPTFREKDVYHRPSCVCKGCAQRRARADYRPRGRGSKNYAKALEQSARSSGLSLT